MIPHRAASPRAFTLLELILVLVIVATLLSVSTASLRGLHASQTTRAAAERFLRLCEQARYRAIHEAIPHRVTVDLNERAYWLSRLGETGDEPVRESIGQRHELDERFTLAAEGVPGQDGIVRIDFFADGRSAPFRVRFATRTEQYDVLRPSMAERIGIE